MHFRVTRSIWFVGLAAFLAVPLVAVLAWDWSWFRASIERAATNAIGRSVAIRGEISVEAGLIPNVVLKDVSLANTMWGQRQVFAHAQQVEISIRLAALLRGDIDVPEVIIDHVNVSLERNADGKVNWDLGRKHPEHEKGSFGRLPVQRVQIREGTIRYDDRQAEVTVKTQILAARLDFGGKKEKASFSANGTIQDAPFDLTIKADAMDWLAGNSGLLPFDLSGRVGSNKAFLTGTIRGPQRPESANVRVHLEGSDISNLAGLAGVELPETPPYVVRGHLIFQKDELRLTDFRAGVGEITMSLAGTIRNVATEPTLDLHLEGEGAGLSLLGTFAELNIPKTPRFSFEGDLSYGNDIWAVEDLFATFGGSDIGGNLKIEVHSGDKTEKPPIVSGELVSESIDFDDFDFLFGIDIDRSKPDRSTARASKNERVIPDIMIPSQALKTVEGDIRIKVKSIENIYGNIDSVSGHLKLKNGMLSVNPIELHAGTGKLSGSGVLDASKDPARVRLNGEVRKLDLATLLPKAATERINGQLGGSVELSGKGNSIAPLLKSLHGNITAFLSGGELNKLLAEVTGLDILGTLRSLVGDKSTKTKIRCMIADFGVEAGILRSKALVLDTDSLILTGDGRISLPAESVDITFFPRARGVNPLSFSAPFSVSGSFRDVTIAPEMVGLGTQAGKTLALGLLLGPLAALAPVIEEKFVGDGNCSAILEDTRSPPPNKPDTAP